MSKQAFETLSNGMFGFDLETSRVDQPEAAVFGGITTKEKEL